MIGCNLRLLDNAVSWLDARSHWFAVLCLAAFTLALYHNALSGWWTNDDLLHLKEAILHSPVEYFFVPRVWQEFMAAFFTPLLTFSYDIDYSLFGLNPAPFYAHQLVSIALAASAFYLLLTLWVPRALALLGATLLLVSTPFALAAVWLAMRHYVDGLALASLALYLWVEGLRRQKPGYRYGSAALYLVAMLAKEVYVPLAALLLVVPEGTWRERLRASWLHWLILVVFLGWRFWMLGGQFGGYGIFASNWESAPGTVVLAVMLLPIRYFLMLFGFTLAPLFIGIFGATFVNLVRSGRMQRIGIALAVLALVSAPLIPVVGDFSPVAPAVTYRFVTVPAAAILFALTIGPALITAGSKHGTLVLLVLALVGVGLWWQGRSVLATWQDPVFLKQEGKFLLTRAPEAEVLSVFASNMDFFYRGIRWLRAHTGHGAAPATVTGAYFGLAPGLDAKRPGRRFYRYELRCDCFREVTADALREREKLMQRMAARPLQVNVNWGRGWLNWSLGPYDKGKYFLLAGQRADYYSSRRAVGRGGSLAYVLDGFMRVGYESPEGWVTFSPEFRVNLAEPGRFDWNSGP